MTRVMALTLCLVWTAGCGGGYPSAQTPENPATGAAEPGMDIREASMPFKVLRADGGQEIPVEDFYGELAGASAVCVGESHSNPHHHWAQLHLVEQVGERARGRAQALGMEMFQRPFQGVLDDYAAGRIGEAELLSRSGWAERWGFDFALYRPIVDTAVAQGMALLALNIANELRRKISRQGLDSLTEAEQSRVPELDLDNEEHKAWFMEEMAALAHAHPGHGKPGHGEPGPKGGHGEPGHGEPGHGKGGHGSPHGHNPHSGKNIYITQVLWDETMAETAADWLAGGEGRQVVILAGNGHCHDSAIVARMRRRGVESVVSVRPIIDNGQGNVAAELARPLTDYLFVMTPGDDTAGSRTASRAP